MLWIFEILGSELTKSFGALRSEILASSPNCLGLVGFFELEHLVFKLRKIDGSAHHCICVLVEGFIALKIFSEIHVE